MKNLLLLTLSVLFVNGLIAQPPQKMSYQTVIRNATNDLVSNTVVGIQISILQGSAAGTALYVEVHAPTTNANGLASLEIGGGTLLTGTFEAIDWAAGPYFVKSEVDPDGGTSYTLSIVSELLSVPYALHASTSADNQWSESGGGINTLSNKVGINVANPEAKLDILGGDWNLDAGNPGDLRIGTANNNFRIGVATGGGGAGITRMYTNSNALILGANDSPSLILEPNGEIKAPSLTNALIESAGDKALVTKEYVEMTSSTGLEAIDEGNGIGWRLVGRNPDNYAVIGENAVDLSISVAATSVFFDYGASGTYSNAFGSHTEASGSYAFASGRYTLASGITSTALGLSSEASGESSTAMGYYTTASGIRSTAMGTITEASGNYSTVMGQNSIASGLTSTAMGLNSIASGVYSTAIGRVANASGDYSIAIGKFITAPSFSETVLGSYNTVYTPLSTSDWNNSDRLLVVGNGNSVFTRSDALTVLKNGNVGIGDSTPDAALDVVGDIHYTGSITDVSDRRLKENLKEIESPLESLNAIQGYSYNMINDSEKQREYGVIAQDLQQVFPEMVQIIDEENGYLGVSYIQLIPVLLEAIKEQQKMIDGQETLIEELRDKSKVQAEALDANVALMKELRDMLNQQTLR